MSFTTMRLQASFVIGTMVLYLVADAANAWLFATWLEHVPGVSWVFLPAGIRLLSTLLFGGAGALGLLIASWLTTFFRYFPDDPQRALVGGIIGALAPWLVYLHAGRSWRFGSSLASLSPVRLLGLSAAYAVANSLLHHLYFAWRGQEELLDGFVAMLVGDLLGTLIVLYAFKVLLFLLRARA